MKEAFGEHLGSFLGGALTTTTTTTTTSFI